MSRGEVLYRAHAEAVHLENCRKGQSLHCKRYSVSAVLLKRGGLRNSRKTAVEAKTSGYTRRRETSKERAYGTKVLEQLMTEGSLALHVSLLYEDHVHFRHGGELISS